MFRSWAAHAGRQDFTEPDNCRTGQQRSFLCLCPGSLPCCVDGCNRIGRTLPQQSPVTMWLQWCSLQFNQFGFDNYVDRFALKIKNEFIPVYVPSSSAVAAKIWRKHYCAALQYSVHLFPTPPSACLHTLHFMAQVPLLVPVLGPSAHGQLCLCSATVSSTLSQRWYGSMGA